MYWTSLIHHLACFFVHRSLLLHGWRWPKVLRLNKDLMYLGGLSVLEMAKTWETDSGTGEGGVVQYNWLVWSRRWRLRSIRLQIFTSNTNLMWNAHCLYWFILIIGIFNPSLVFWQVFHLQTVFCLWKQSLIPNEDNQRIAEFLDLRYQTE